MSNLTTLIRPKSVPNKAIYIKPVDEETPSHHYTCKCDMCQSYEKNKLRQLHHQRYQIVSDKISSRLQKKPFAFQGKNRTPILPYKKLLKLLLPPNNKIVLRGLDLFITETLFFKNGQPSLILYNREWDDPMIKKIGKQHKFNTNAVQKLFNDRRRQYNNNLNTLLGRKKKKSQQDLSKKFKKTIKDEKKPASKNLQPAVMIVYHDQSVKLITEHEFIMLLGRRKLDPIWQEINYLKNYLFVEKQLQRTFVMKFKEDEIEIEGLYQRSKQLMRVYGENSYPGDKDYISEKQEEQFCYDLRAQSYRLYALYALYKIVSFVEKFHDQKITLLVAKFVINEEGKLYFQNVFKLQMTSLFKYSWNNELYMKKIEKEEQRIFFTKEIKAEYCEANAKKVEKTMQEIYQKSKNYYGLSVQVQDDEQEKANNQFYRFMHPEIQNDISEILKDKNMTVKKFKKDFLGFKPIKKPIVRPYTSDMLRVLNETTRVFHRAKPHDYISVPKRQISTAMSGSTRRKSFLSKNSTSTRTPRTGFFEN